MSVPTDDPEMVAELKRIEVIVEENFEEIEEKDWR